MQRIYLIGSLRNPEVPRIAQRLRALGHDVFDDWYSVGPEADDRWQEYERDRGRTFVEALSGFHAIDVFEFDKHHLDDSDIAVMVMPAGKSGHLELGYIIGQGKPGYILMPGEPDRFDIMYRFATGVFYDTDTLARALEEHGRGTEAAGRNEV